MTKKQVKGKVILLSEEQFEKLEADFYKEGGRYRSHFIRARLLAPPALNRLSTRQILAESQKRVVSERAALRAHAKPSSVTHRVYVDLTPEEEEEVIRGAAEWMLTPQEYSRRQVLREDPRAHSALDDEFRREERIALLSSRRVRRVND